MTVQDTAYNAGPQSGLDCGCLAPSPDDGSGANPAYISSTYVWRPWTGSAVGNDEVQAPADPTMLHLITQ
eukprot:1075782-Amphidinium_carterae.1